MNLKEIFIRAKNCTSYNEFKRNLLKEFWGKELTPPYNKVMEKIRVTFNLPIEYQFPKGHQKESENKVK